MNLQEKDVLEYVFNPNKLSRSIFQIEANKTIPCLIMFMAMVCRDGSIHPRCHGGRRYVER